MTESFASAFDRFLRSVKDRDRATFLSFLHPNEPLRAVLPGGKEFNDYKAYVELQDVWFLGKTGSFDYQVQTTHESAQTGLGVVRVDYHNEGPEGVPFHFDLLITFAFRKRDGHWVKYFSHNTVLEN